MYKKLWLVLLSVSLFCNTTYSFAKEPQNLFIVKTKLAQYHDSGTYEKDQAKVIQQAMEYLKTRLDREKKLGSIKKLAIVLDIDETSLSNYPNMVKMNFGGTKQEIDDAAGEGKDPVILPTLILYRYAKENHVAVFFITGRPENYRPHTESNLNAAGYKNWDGLILRSAADYKEKTTSAYKTQAREQIEKQGYDIVLNIGDQQSDLVGGHADKTFKMPNPYYFLP